MGGKVDHFEDIVVGSDTDCTTDGADDIGGDGGALAVDSATLKETDSHPKTRGQEPVLHNAETPQIQMTKSFENYPGFVFDSSHEKLLDYDYLEGKSSFCPRVDWRCLAACRRNLPGCPSNVCRVTRTRGDFEA